MGTEKLEVLMTRSFESSLPKQVFLKKAEFEGYLSLTFKDGGAKQSSEFLLEDTIIEYRSNLGKEEIYTESWREHKYNYLKDYVSVGIPTARYEWIFKEADKQGDDGKMVDFITTQSDGYTWVYAEINPDQTLNCTMYVEEADNLEIVGTLFDKMQTLKSNIIGVGKFQVAVVYEYIEQEDEKHYFLKFVLKEFQITNRTEITSQVKSFVDVQPPEDLVKALRSTKRK